MGRRVGKLGLEEDKGRNWIDRTVRGSSLVVLMLRERLRGRGDWGNHRELDGESVRSLWYTFSRTGVLCFAKAAFLPSFGQILAEP